MVVEQLDQHQLYEARFNIFLVGLTTLRAVNLWMILPWGGKLFPFKAALEPPNTSFF